MKFSSEQLFLPFIYFADSVVVIVNNEADRLVRRFLKFY